MKEKILVKCCLCHHPVSINAECCPNCGEPDFTVKPDVKSVLLTTEEDTVVEDSTVKPNVESVLLTTEEDVADEDSAEVDPLFELDIKDYYRLLDRKCMDPNSLTAAELSAMQHYENNRKESNSGEEFLRGCLDLEGWLGAAWGCVSIPLKIIFVLYLLRWIVAFIF